MPSRFNKSSVDVEALLGRVDIVEVIGRFLPLILVVVSWPGGGKAVDKADWSPLAGRKVLGWADCDGKRERLTPLEKAAGLTQADKPLLSVEKQPGVMAMTKVGGHVLAQGGRWWDVVIPAPGAKPDGWDIADAIAEGLRGQALADHIRANLIEHKPSLPAEPAFTPTEAGAGRDRKEPWIPGLIWGRDGLKNCLSNVYQILAHRPERRGGKIGQQATRHQTSGVL